MIDLSAVDRKGRSAKELARLGDHYRCVQEIERCEHHLSVRAGRTSHDESDARGAMMDGEDVAGAGWNAIQTYHDEHLESGRAHGLND